MCVVSASAGNGRRGPVLVSACLLGLPTRYDAAHSRREGVVRMLRGCPLIPVCPEQLGGMPTPRHPAEITAGSGRDVLEGRARLVDDQGTDVTEQCLRGARTVARIADLFGVRRAVLKEGSPSCGVRRVKRRGRDVEGSGVTAALLRQRGIEVEGIE